jgi:DNA-binding NarL/FixJ family response regulator
VVGEAEDGFDAIAKTQALDPDLVILDISMPRKDGLEVLAGLTEMKMRGRILVLSLRDSKELAAYGQRAGAPGYVIKTQAGRDLAPAVRDIFHSFLRNPPHRPHPKLTDAGSCRLFALVAKQ